MTFSTLTDASKEAGANKALITAVVDAAGISHNAAVDAVNGYMIDRYRTGDPLLVDAIIAHSAISEDLRELGLTIVEDRAEIEPSPADDLEIGEVRLPEFIRAGCLVPELISRPDHHMGWGRD